MKDMPGMKFKLRSIDGFLDGNVLPFRVNAGQVVEVDYQTKLKCLQSDPQGWESLGMIPPPSTQEVASDSEESTSRVQEGSSANRKKAGRQQRKGRGNTGSSKPVSFPSGEEA